MTCNRYNASSGLVEHRVCLINFNGAPIRICDDCRQYLFQQLDPAAESPPKSASDICANDFATNGIMESVERSTIEQALKDSGGNKFETAKRLGIGRQTLYNKIKAYRIKV